jgi:hypothetical protein
VRNEEVLHRVKEERNIVHTIKRRKANWIGHSLHRNCLLKHVVEGKEEGRIEVTGRRGRRRQQLLDDFKEKRGYWKFKEEALDRTLWRTRFGRSYGPVVGQTTGGVKNFILILRSISVQFFCLCLNLASFFLLNVLCLNYMNVYMHDRR